MAARPPGWPGSRTTHGLARPASPAARRCRPPTPGPALPPHPGPPEVAAPPRRRAREARSDLSPVDEVARPEHWEHGRPAAARRRRPVHTGGANDRRVCDVPGNDGIGERRHAGLRRRRGGRPGRQRAGPNPRPRATPAARLGAMPTTTEPPPKPASTGVAELPSLALSSAARTLRVTTVIVLLIGVVAGGAALRAHQAAHPAPPRSADERAYLTLAHDLAATGDYGGPGVEMDDPLHWPPAAPALFAAAEKISPGAGDEFAPRSIYTAQAIVDTLAILAAFGAAALLAGAWAGLAAAAATAFYPPLVDISGRALSEPLGALGVALTILACAWAARRPAEWRFAIAGVLFGATLLARAGLAPAVPLLALWAVWVARRPRGWRRAGLCGAALAAGALIAVAPWVRAASERAGHLVPVSTSGGSAIFVGTYLPRHGTMFRLKRSLGNQLRLQAPRMGSVPNFRLPQERILDLVAERHPELGRDAALEREARANLDRYALRHPARFTGMLADKAARMWVTPNRGPHGRLTAVRLSVHLLLIALALAGTILAAVLVRRPGLGAILVLAGASTAINAVFLSEPRHLLPLIPALFATGAAGWAMLLARRRGFGKSATR